MKKIVMKTIFINSELNAVFGWCNINYVITLPYWLTDSGVNTVGRGLRFSRNDRMDEVIKLFITWHQQQKFSEKN